MDPHRQLRADAPGRILAGYQCRSRRIPEVVNQVELLIAAGILPGGCLICEGLRNLPESEDPLTPTSGGFWSVIDGGAGDSPGSASEDVWVSFRRRGYPVRRVAVPGEENVDSGPATRTTYVMDLQEAFGDRAPRERRRRRNRKPDLHVRAEHAPRERISVFLGFMARKFRKGGGQSEGGVVTIQDGYWPFFKNLLQAGAEQTGVLLSLADPPVPVDEADLAYLQHRRELTGQFRKVLNFTKAVEVEGEHQEELIAFRDRVLTRFGPYADPEAYLSLCISEWDGGLRVGAQGEGRWGFTMFGRVPQLLAALERAIADCARDKGHGGEDFPDAPVEQET